MNDEAFKPVEIVGGGLAGLALGIGLRRAGVPVTVFEAGQYPRHRVCGEFITGLSEDVVARLGIGDVFKNTLQHDTVRWHAGGRAIARMRLPEAAKGISRHALDARLATLFTATGGRLVTCHRAESGAREGRVWAAGRRRIRKSPWVGLKAHVREMKMEADLEFHLGANAYVGLSQVEDGWINVCGLFEKRAGLAVNTPSALARTLRDCGLERLATRMEAAQLRPGSACSVAGFVFDDQVERRDEVVLGDACAMIPPFTGNGMAMAFTSAAIALDPLTVWARGAATWGQTTACIHDRLHDVFRTRLRRAAWMHPFLLERRGQRALGLVAKSRLLPLRPLYHLVH